MSKNIDFHKLWFGESPAWRMSFAAGVGTSQGYLERVAGGFALPSTRMLVRLNRADKRVTLAAILPRYEEKSGAIA